MKRGNVKKWVGAVLALCLALGVMSLRTAFAADPITLTLDNGVYDSAYMSTYGTVEYSSDGEHWNPITTGTTYAHVTDEGQNSHNYTFDSAVTSVQLRTVAVAPNTAELMDGPNSIPLTDNVPQTVTGGWHLQFKGPGGGASDPNPDENVVNNGDIKIAIRNSQNGATAYKIGTGNWETISGGDFTLRHEVELSNIATGTIIYVKAVPNSEQELDAPGCSLDNHDDNAGTAIDVSVLNSENGFSFTYDSTKAVSVNIEYKNNSGGEQGGSGGEGGGQQGGQTSGITIRLDNGVYAVGYKAANGTVEYSLDNAAWKEINVGTTADGANYTISAAATVYLRVRDVADGKAAYIDGSQTVMASEGVTLTDSCHLEFRSAGGEGGAGGGDPIVSYPVKAYFSGVATPVEMELETGYIQLPDRWTGGSVTFKAQVYFLDGDSANTFKDNLCPNDGSSPAGAVAGEVALVLEGINNSDLIERTVIPGAIGAAGKPDSVVVLEGFAAYGRAGLHLEGPDNSNVSALPQLVTADLINIRSEACTA